MAKVTQPLMSLGARGKMGALIYNQWRGFNTVKCYTAPVQPDTDDQLALRALMADAVSAWQALTPAERTSWIDYAPLHLESDWTGSQKRLTGQNWYVRGYAFNTLCGETPIDTAPSDPAPPALVGAGFAYVAGPPKKVTLTWTAPVAETSYLQIWVTPPLSPGRVPKFPLADQLTPIGADTQSPYDVVNPITAGRYGFWVRVIDTLTSLASGWTSSDLVIP